RSVPAGQLSRAGRLQPLGAGVPAPGRRRRGAVREQPVPVPAADRAEPERMGRLPAGRADRKGPLPPSHEPAVPAHAGALRLLLVLAQTSGRSPGRGGLMLLYREWLPHQRWYAGRQREIAAVTPAITTPLRENLDHVLVDVAYTDHTKDRYQVLIVWDQAPETAAVATIGSHGDRTAYDALYHE